MRRWCGTSCTRAPAPRWGPTPTPEVSEYQLTHRSGHIPPGSTGPGAASQRSTIQRTHATTDPLDHASTVDSGSLVHWGSNHAPLVR